MEIDRQLILDSFLAESEEGLAAIEQHVLELEREFSLDRVQAIFRVVHTLKGNASIFALDELGAFVHRIENYLDRVRSGISGVSADNAKTLLALVDVLREAIPALAAGQPFPLNRHEALLDQLAADQLPAQFPIMPEATAAVNSARSVRTLRVAIEKLDALLDLAGEIGIAQARMRDILAQRSGGHDDILQTAFASADALYLQLQDQVMSLRMVAIGPTLRSYSRIAHDVAVAAGKQVRLSIEGEDVGVDLSVLELIRDPLTHMVRNAVDHGIETPEERHKAGKPPAGLLELRASHEASSVVIELTDDGAGLNRARIAERARSTGLCADPEKLSDSDLFSLIFEPGFSTAATVTGISGRGVGLDVVRKNIEALHGRVDISSEEGRGTTVTLRMPLTLAMVDAFVVSVAGERYLLPLENMVECMDLPADRIEDHSCRGVISVRGTAVPYVRISALFGTSARSRHEKVVLVTDAGSTTGLVVDELIGEQQAVIKPLGHLFRGLRGISGSTILGDGHVALVLDIPSLVRTAINQAAAAANH